MFTGHALHREPVFGRKPHFRHQCLLAMFYMGNKCLLAMFYIGKPVLTGHVLHRELVFTGHVLHRNKYLLDGYLTEGACVDWMHDLLTTSEFTGWKIYL